MCGNFNSLKLLKSYCVDLKCPQVIYRSISQRVHFRFRLTHTRIEPIYAFISAHMHPLSHESQQQ